MATDKYNKDTADYGTTGWNAIYKDAIETLDAMIHTYMLTTWGEAVTAGQVVYQQINSKWYLAQGNGMHMPVQGFVVANGILDGSGKIQTVGLMTNAGWSLTPGRGVWLSGTTRGAITQTKPASNAQFLGMAVTATSINIQISMGDAVSMPMSTTTTTTTTSSTTTTTTTTA